MNSKNEPRFLIDFMVGRLTKWLRIFGYDTLYIRPQERSTIIMQSLKENRILVTRDHSLSRKKAWKLILVQSGRLNEQLKQVINESKILISDSRFYTRCTICNGQIKDVESKETVKSCVPEYVYKIQNSFACCSNCGKVYWPGTHRDLLLKELIKMGIKI